MRRGMHWTTSPRPAAGAWTPPLWPKAGPRIHNVLQNVHRLCTAVLINDIFLIAKSYGGRWWKMIVESLVKTAEVQDIGAPIGLLMRKPRLLLAMHLSVMKR